MNKLMRFIFSLEKNNGASTLTADTISQLFVEPSHQNFPTTFAAVSTWLNASESQNASIQDWLLSCISESAKTRPTEKWLKNSHKTLSSLSESNLEQNLRQLMDAITTDLKSLHKSDQSNRYYYHLQTPTWFCGIAWFAGYHLGRHAEARYSLDQLANWSFKKYPGMGAFASKLGNACLRGFAYMPAMEGITALFRFRNKAKNRNIIKLTETLLREAAERQQMTRSDLEDLSVPTFGLDDNQSRTTLLGDFKATLCIRNQSETVLEWQNAQGKILKSVPAAVKASFQSELKQLQLAHKELRSTLSTQNGRIEYAYLQRRSWHLTVFSTRYVQHPVLQTLATRLIWQFEDAGHQDAAIFYEGKWQNCEGNTLDWLTDGTTVQLWHPLGSKPETVLQWRDWLMEKGITQPFKQAYREIYIVTPPEVRTSGYSNRFAAHVIRQHQFSAIAVLRDWQYTLQGEWDSHNTPYRNLPDWNYRIEFWVEPVADNAPVSDTGVFVYVNTDQVRFYHNGALVNMPDVPPMLFSELMRDVDLFVGVCSIGNDPNWEDTGDNRFNTYWRNYAFAEELAESGKMRRAALERLIPRLKIASQCHFTDRYLVVQGKKHAYKIHCGSGNILMSPNDQYLCIVPESRPKQNAIYLPFEGDRMLSIIISKALLLAEDDKIKDLSITMQL